VGSDPASENIVPYRIWLPSDPIAVTSQQDRLLFLTDEALVFFPLQDVKTESIALPPQIPLGISASEHQIALLMEVPSRSLGTASSENASQNIVYLWQDEQWMPIAQTREHLGFETALTWAGDETWFVMAAYQPATTTLSRVDLGNFPPSVHSLVQVNGTITSLDIHPHYQWIAYAVLGDNLKQVYILEDERHPPFPLLSGRTIHFVMMFERAFPLASKRSDLFPSTGINTLLTAGPPYGTQHRWHLLLLGGFLLFYSVLANNYR